MNKNNVLAILAIFTSMHLHAELELIGDIPAAKNDYYQYLLATYLHSSGKAMPALGAYKELIKTNQSPYVYHGLFGLLFDMEQFQTLIQTYQSKHAELEKIFENDISMQLILAQSYLETAHTAKAEEIFLRLATLHPENEQIAYCVTVAYIKNNQLDRALAFSNKCLKNPALKQKYFLFHFLNSKILIQQNKLAQALVHIEKSLELFPRFDRALLFKAILLEQMGRINDAINGYKSFLEIVGSDLPVEKQLTQLLFSQNRFNEALEYMKRFKTDSPDYFFDCALIELKAGNNQKALECIESAIKKDQQFSKAKLLKVEILLQSQKIPETLAFMRDWILADSADLEIIETFLLLRKTGVKKEAMIKTLQNIERTKAHANILAAIADLYKELNNYPQAIAYYQKILPLTKDPALISKTLFQIGYLYYITKQPVKLEQVLQKAITYSPVYPSAYNLLAYHYAHANKNLTGALELIDKALAAAPECSYYLDTKGYILHKLGKRDAAVDTYKQALKRAPHDMIIQNHLKIVQGNQ